MLYLDKVPNHAILNEAVEIAKAKGNPGIGKFVNGVLRTIQREGVPALDQIKDPLERLAIEISMPLWLTERFVAQIGSDKTRELGLSLLVPSHASGRLDLLKNYSQRSHPSTTGRRNRSSRKPTISVWDCG